MLKTVALAPIPSPTIAMLNTAALRSKRRDRSAFRISWATFNTETLPGFKTAIGQVVPGEGFRAESLSSCYASVAELPANGACREVGRVNVHVIGGGVL